MESPDHCGTIIAKFAMAKLNASALQIMAVRNIPCFLD
jgi:hypothetical protein